MYHLGEALKDELMCPRPPKGDAFTFVVSDILLPRTRVPFSIAADGELWLEHIVEAAKKIVGKSATILPPADLVATWSNPTITAETAAKKRK